LEGNVKNRFLLLVAVLASGALVVLSPSNAEANDTECVGALTGTFDNVIVPPGQTCILTNATVGGNVKALEASRLSINRSTVHGNVETEKSDIFQILFSTVRQQVSIKGGGPAAPPAPLFNVCGFGIDFTPCEVLILATTVEEGNVHIEKMAGSIVIQALSVPLGNVKIEENSIEVPELFLLDNATVGQNVQIFKNTGAGNKFVQNNRVGENLQCFENDPPFVAQFNMARQAEGQCASPVVP
jgi:hypothetical protein